MAMGVDPRTHQGGAGRQALAAAFLREPRRALRASANGRTALQALERAAERFARP
jgi:hypothetical protein